MSRVGRQPIVIPEKVDVSINGNEISVKGPHGALKPLEIKSPIDVKINGNEIVVSRPDDKKASRELHGLYRSLINNMILGVSQGYKKELEVNGVGYRAKVEGDKLVVQVGYTHPLEFPVPENFKVDVDKNNVITIFGPDKQLVGQMAASIRASAPCDVYKLKGIKYKSEVIQKKAGKTVK